MDPRSGGKGAGVPNRAGEGPHDARSPLPPMVWAVIDEERAHAPGGHLSGHARKIRASGLRCGLTRTSPSRSCRSQRVRTWACSVVSRSPRHRDRPTLCTSITQGRRSHHRTHRRRGGRTPWIRGDQGRGPALASVDQIDPCEARRALKLKRIGHCRLRRSHPVNRDGVR